MPYATMLNQEFQFLIGTVKTSSISKVVVNNSLFQFLIGTVKTGRQLHSYLPHFYVSIPHRYCKNQGTIKLQMQVLVVSIPHRYCKNYNSIHNTGNSIEQFQFLIGTVKTKDAYTSSFTTFAFQFLIGTVKTL